MNFAVFRTYFLSQELIPMILPGLLIILLRKNRVPQFLLGYLATISTFSTFISIISPYWLMYQPTRMTCMAYIPSLPSQISGSPSSRDGFLTLLRASLFFQNSLPMWWFSEFIPELANIILSCINYRYTSVLFHVKHILYERSGTKSLFSVFLFWPHLILLTL